MIDKKAGNTEQLILEAAERLFLEKGFALTSTTEIARSAGCNQALVHYYFRTKEKLFEEVFQKKIIMFVSSFMRIDEDNLPFEEKLRRKIEAHYEILLDNPQLPFLILNELITNPARIKKLKENFDHLPLAVFTQLENDINTEISKGTMRPITPINLIFSVVSLNVAVFLAKPVMMTLTEMNDVEFTEFARQRKDENVRMVLRSIRQP